MTSLNRFVEAEKWRPRRHLQPWHAMAMAKVPGRSDRPQHVSCVRAGHRAYGCRPFSHDARCELGFERILQAQR